MVLVDTNVLVDVLAEPGEWTGGSRAGLEAAAAEGELAINPIIFAELATNYRTEAELERASRVWPLLRLELPYAAGFPAARAFLRYRGEGGTRRSPLPEFYIGAHAQIAELTLLTRDATRYRSHFPKVRSIAPDR